MNDIKLYGICDGCMEDVENGNYVKLDDYERLMLRCAELEADARRLDAQNESARFYNAGEEL